MRLKIIILLCFSLLMPIGVLAEDLEESVPPSNAELKLYLPESFTGSVVSITDSEGSLIAETEVDETGQGSLTLPVSPESFSLKAGGPIESTENENTSASPQSYLSYLILILPLIALIFYILGRISLIRVLRDLKEVVYDETLD